MVSAQRAAYPGTLPLVRVTSFSILFAALSSRDSVYRCMPDMLTTSQVRSSFGWDERNSQVAVVAVSAAQG